MNTLKKLEMKNKRDIMFINQAVNLLQQIYDNEKYIGFQTEQSPWTPTLGYDYSFICPDMNIIIKITNDFIHILQDNEKIYAIPISGNYVIIQEMCEKLMSASIITNISTRELTDKKTVLTTKRFEKR